MQERLVTLAKKNVVETGLIAVGVVCFVMMGIYAWISRPSQETLQVLSAETESGEVRTEIYVDVSGAVGKSGVYAMPLGSRIADALERAGGVTSEASTEFVEKSLNRSEKIVDGMKIYIPKKQEMTQAGSSSSSKLISVNNAASAQLEELPGIGPVTAQKIIANRMYSRLEQVKEKAEISAKTWEKIKGLIQL